MRAALLTDDELLTTPDPEAFGVFYARHRAGVEAYFTRRVRGDAAADLTAETFASALVARRRFSPGETPAAGWLYTIAARRLIDFQRRSLVERRTLVELEARGGHSGSSAHEQPPPGLDPTAGLLRHLQSDQRHAILAHVLADLGYSQVAAQVNASEASIRQRVSRGLATLRPPLRLHRAAHALASQRRAYRLGAGHQRDLRSISAQEALDCSAAASLILHQAGLLASDTASTSSLLAETWGEPGEGRYATLWANDDHVWFEFNLEHDHAERFDPTPRLLAPSGRWTPTARDPTRDFAPRHWPGT